MPDDPRPPKNLEATIQPGDMPADMKAQEPLGLRIADRYRITETLGRGGVGVVYRARDAIVNEDVAIKLLHATEERDEKDTERFRRELVTARKVSHPNVIRIHDMGVLGNEFYISMELLEGGTLSALLRRGPVPIERAVEIAIGICDGLEAAHRSNVIHRDIKPDNVLFDRAGVPKLVDFGLARLAGSLSRTAGFSGTPFYMSPEQADGADPTAQSDLYSLGVLLFEMFTGQRPFISDSLIRLVVLHQKEPPPRPTSIRPEIPPAIEALILRTLEKKPADRPQSAAEIASALRGNSRTAVAPVPEIPARRSRRGWIAAGAALAVPLVVALVMIDWNPNSPSATPTPLSSPTVAIGVPSSTPVASETVAAQTAVPSPTRLHTTAVIVAPTPTRAALSPTPTAPVAAPALLSVNAFGRVAVEVYADGVLVGSVPLPETAVPAGTRVLSFRNGDKVIEDIPLNALSGARYGFSATRGEDGAISIRRTQ